MVEAINPALQALEGGLHLLARPRAFVGGIPA